MASILSRDLRQASRFSLRGLGIQAVLRPVPKRPRAPTSRWGSKPPNKSRVRPPIRLRFVLTTPDVVVQQAPAPGFWTPLMALVRRRGPRGWRIPASRAGSDLLGRWGDRETDDGHALRGIRAAGTEAGSETRDEDGHWGLRLVPSESYLFATRVEAACPGRGAPKAGDALAVSPPEAPRLRGRQGRLKEFIREQGDSS